MRRFLDLVCPALLLLGLAMSSSSAQSVPFDGKTFKGHIAWSADGNHNDEDDWAASPVALAIFAASGVKDRLVHFDYNCILTATDPHAKLRSLLQDNLVATPVGPRQQVRIEAENFQHLDGYELEYRTDRSASHRLNIKRTNGTAGQIRTRFDQPYTAVRARYDVDVRYLDERAVAAGLCSRSTGPPGAPLGSHREWVKGGRLRPFATSRSAPAMKSRWRLRARQAGSITCSSIALLHANGNRVTIESGLCWMECRLNWLY